MMHVKLRSALADEEMRRIAEERKPAFAAIPGLIQKYYLKYDEPGTYAGVYIWENMDSLKAFRESELAATIGAAYQTVQPPEVTLTEIMFPLRDQP